jgi:hypothetical protein
MGIREKKAESVTTSVIDGWLSSCERKGKLSRNTIAVGIVILDKLREKSPLEPSDILSEGGEVKGARSSLGRVLERVGIPGFLKECTTRQAHQDGQRLLNMLEYGRVFDGLSTKSRETILNISIERLVREAHVYLSRQNLKVICGRDASPAVWVAANLVGHG